MSFDQAEYYQKYGIHSCYLSLEDKQVFTRHLATRKNLYQNILQIPMSLLAGKDVLDVGCGTGESAVVAALYGANITLLDADKSSLDKALDLFSQLGVEDRIAESSLSYLDQWTTHNLYSLVVAEGFVHTMINRDEVMARLCGLLQPGGLGVVSVSDRFGSFMEFLKKGVMWRAYQLAGIDDIHSDEALAIGRRLHEPAFLALNSPRNFDLWWEDSLTIPTLNWDQSWSHYDILNLIANYDCEYYSSSPRYHVPPRLEWFKRVKSKEERHKAVLSSFQSRKFDAMFGQKIGLLESDPDFPTLEEYIESILKSFSLFFTSLEQPAPSFNFSEPGRCLKEKGAPSDVIDELVIFFNLLDSNSLDELIDGYSQLTTLANTWGCGFQYLCFTKNDFVSDEAF